MVVLKLLSNAGRFTRPNIMNTKFRRYNSTFKKVYFEKFGDPLKVLKLVEEPLPSLQPDEVFVKFLVASVNPADLNLIQGVYPIKIQTPAVAGLTGVGEVIEVGSNVKGLKPGDRVVPDTEGFGTWRTSGVFKPDVFLKIPKDFSEYAAAGITSNPCSAYRMLSDYVSLQPGDVVIQNGGNSACGQDVIQLCRIKNCTSVSVVRDRPNIEELKSYLVSIGANYVFTEEELRNTDIFKTKIPKPKLALNCIGGRTATDMTRHLANQGIMVTYGGMSREPVSIPTSAFIFKDMTFKGFWLTRWTRDNKKSEKRRQMFNDLAEYYRSGRMKAPAHQLIPLANFTEAIKKASNREGFTGCKYLIDLKT